MSRASIRFSTIDALLVLMVLIWGVNYSVIKHAFLELPPQVFNGLRLAIASTVFLAAIRVARRRARRPGAALSRIVHTAAPLTARDRWQLVWLGLVGHSLYQLCFVGGIALTSVSNSALIIGATPVVVAIASAVTGHDRIGRLHWLGAAVSAFGIYLVVAHGSFGGFGGATLRGDLLVMVSVSCWAAYTIGAAKLIARHSPLYVTGMTMAIGGIPYALMSVPAMFRLPWAGVSTWTWCALVLSALLALNVAYLIWYTAIQRIGPARTSMYSNLVPISAMAGAALYLGEPISGIKILGAVAVLGGVLLTRLGRPPVAVALEE